MITLTIEQSIPWRWIPVWEGITRMADEAEHEINNRTMWAKARIESAIDGDIHQITGNRPGRFDDQIDMLSQLTSALLLSNQKSATIGNNMIMNNDTRLHFYNSAQASSVILGGAAVYNQSPSHAL